MTPVDCWLLLLALLLLLLLSWFLMLLLFLLFVRLLQPPLFYLHNYCWQMSAIRNSSKTGTIDAVAHAWCIVQINTRGFCKMVPGVAARRRGAGGAYGAWRDVLRAIIKRPVSSPQPINEKFTMQKEFAPLDSDSHSVTQQLLNEQTRTQNLLIFLSSIVLCLHFQWLQLFFSFLQHPLRARGFCVSLFSPD